MRTSVDIQDVGPHVVHSVPPHSVHVYVNISGIVLPEAQNCVTRWAGDTFGSLDVGITVCDNPASLVPMAAGMSGIAMCVPPLYGTDLTLESLRHHANHHRRLGVEWTFLYLASRRAPHASSNVIQQAARGLAMTAPNVTLLRLPWLWEFPLHQRGQTWQINDCIHRAASTHFEWTLNIDVDEFVFLYRPRVPHLAESALMTIPQLIEQTSTFKTSVISLGSRIVKEFVPNGTLGMSERAHVRGGLIYCWNARRVYTPWLCSKHWGRRKHLTRTQHVWFAAVHEATHCKSGPCVVSNLDARSYWLLHVRPTGTFNPPTYKHMPTGRRTSEIHNDMLPKARNELVPQVVSHGRASVPQRAVTVVTAFIALPSNRTKHGYELNHTVNSRERTNRDARMQSPVLLMPAGKCVPPIVIRRAWGVSRSACRLDQTYGCYDGELRMWASTPCRSTFRCSNTVVLCGNTANGRQNCTCDRNAMGWPEGEERAVKGLQEVKRPQTSPANLWLGAIISMNARGERFAMVTREVSLCGFVPMHVPAAMPSHFTSAAAMVDELFGDSKLLPIQMSAYEMGLLISHKRALATIAQSTYDWGGIFEDDAYLSKLVAPWQASYLIQSAFSSADERALVYLGACDPHCEPTDQTHFAGLPVALLRGHRCKGLCTHAYALSRRLAGTFFADVFNCHNNSKLCGAECTGRRCQADWAFVRHLARGHDAWMVGGGLRSRFRSDHRGLFVQNRSSFGNNNKSGTALKRPFSWSRIHRRYFGYS